MERWVSSLTGPVFNFHHLCGQSQPSEILVSGDLRSSSVLHHYPSCGCIRTQEVNPSHFFWTIALTQANKICEHQSAEKGPERRQIPVILWGFWNCIPNGRQLRQEFLDSFFFCIRCREPRENQAWGGSFSRGCHIISSFYT